MDIKAPNEGYQRQLDVERITESKVMGMKYNTSMRSHCDIATDCFRFASSMHVKSFMHALLAARLDGTSGD